MGDASNQDSTLLSIYCVNDAIDPEPRSKDVLGALDALHSWRKRIVTKGLGGVVQFCREIARQPSESLFGVSVQDEVPRRAASGLLWVYSMTVCPYRPRRLACTQDRRNRRFVRS